MGETTANAGKCATHSFTQVYIIELKVTCKDEEITTSISLLSYFEHRNTYYVTKNELESSLFLNSIILKAKLT